MLRIIKIQNRIAEALRGDKGMEAAQVIVILAIVALVLFPVISNIVSGLENNGNEVVNEINKY